MKIVSSLLKRMSFQPFYIQVSKTVRQHLLMCNISYLHVKCFGFPPRNKKNCVHPVQIQHAHLAAQFCHIFNDFVGLCFTQAEIVLITAIVAELVRLGCVMYNSLAASLVVPFAAIVRIYFSC